MLAPGDQLPPFVIDRVDPQAMRDWAVFLHDPNPIHLDVEVVKAKGLGDKVINQGPANVAYLINMLTAAFPGARVAKMESRFIDNVYAGDRVTAGGRVTRVDAGQVECEIWLRAEGRDAVITGSATLSTPAPA